MSVVKEEALKTLRSENIAKIMQGKQFTHSFNVDFSDINEDFVGKFTVHMPSQIERLKMGITKSSLLGGNLQVDTITDNIAHMISTLDIVCDEIPEWFDITDPELDYNILEAVFLEYFEWQKSFRSKPKENANEGTSTGATS